MTTLINPLRLAPEPGFARHLDNLVGRILVAALGPDRLAFHELGVERGRCDVYPLPAIRAQMHLHAPGIVIDPRYVRELSQVKVRVNSRLMRPSRLRLKAAVTRVHHRKLRAIERWASPGPSPTTVSHRPAGSGVSLPGIPYPRDDRSSQSYFPKTIQTILDAFPARCYLEQTGQVFPLQADNANGINITEFPFTLGESPRGYFDGIVRRTLFTARALRATSGSSCHYRCPTQRRLPE